MGSREVVARRIESSEQSRERHGMKAMAESFGMEGSKRGGSKYTEQSGKRADQKAK